MADWKQGLMDGIPGHMWGAVERYVLQGIHPGGFLYAVLCNDLKGAFMKADEVNIRHMKQWAQFMYWDMPSDSQGSPAKVEAWMAHGGLMGLQQRGIEADPVQDDAADLHT